MKDGLRFVDCDMHIMEPPDFFERHLDVSFNPHFDSNVPNVSINVLKNVAHEIAAEIFLGGAAQFDHMRSRLARSRSHRGAAFDPGSAQGHWRRPLLIAFPLAGRRAALDGGGTKWRNSRR